MELYGSVWSSTKRRRKVFIAINGRFSGALQSKSPFIFEIIHRLIHLILNKWVIKIMGWEKLKSVTGVPYFVEIKLLFRLISVIWRGG